MIKDNDAEKFQAYFGYELPSSSASLLMILPVSYICVDGEWGSHTQA